MEVYYNKKIRTLKANFWTKIVNCPTATQVLNVHNSDLDHPPQDKIDHHVNVK